jgi:hypothetical protein
MILLEDEMNENDIIAINDGTPNLFSVPCDGKRYGWSACQE